MNSINSVHERVMLSILRSVSDTPLLLKGGTALMLAYGLDRFSEDLDFDSSQKINLNSRIKNSIPDGVSINGIDVLKDTSTVTRYRIRYQSHQGKRNLKIEISYRSPPNAFHYTQLPPPRKMLTLRDMRGCCDELGRG